MILLAIKIPTLPFYTAPYSLLLNVLATEWPLNPVSCTINKAHQVIPCDKHGNCVCSSMHPVQKRKTSNGKRNFSEKNNGIIEIFGKKI